MYFIKAKIRIIGMQNLIPAIIEIKSLFDKKLKKQDVKIIKQINKKILLIVRDLLRINFKNDIKIINIKIKSLINFINIFVDDLACTDPDKKLITS